MTATRSIKPFGLRMQPEDKAWIEEQARKTGRSVNSMVCQIIKQAREVKEEDKTQAA
jgi:predicted HicB family RNase H-like nuclease